MVKLTVKKGDEVRFVLDTNLTVKVGELRSQICQIHNGQLKVERICADFDELAKHGLTLPLNMHGLTKEQITELKLIDEWTPRCEPSGGPYTLNEDTMGRRNGHAPSESMAAMISQTAAQCKAMVRYSNSGAELQEITLDKVNEALDLLRGAMMIVYPMGLPPHEPIKREFEGDESHLEGTAARQAILEEGGVSGATTRLWFAGKEMTPDSKTLRETMPGATESTKAVVKVTSSASGGAAGAAGAPAREPIVSEKEQREMMMHWHRRQEELKKLEAAETTNAATCLAGYDSEWADGQRLKRQFHGLADIRWRPS